MHPEPTEISTHTCILYFFQVRLITICPSILTPSIFQIFRLLFRILFHGHLRAVCPTLLDLSALIIFSKQ
jgi:hypothetical protein